MVTMGNGFFNPNFNSNLISNTLLPNTITNAGALTPNTVNSPLSSQQPNVLLQQGIATPAATNINPMSLMANNLALTGRLFMQLAAVMQMMITASSSANAQPSTPANNPLVSLIALLCNAMAAATSQTPPPEYNSGNSSRYWGDPHLIGFDGEKYDVMGQGGNFYNMVSDKNMQYNTKFINWGRPGKDGVQPTVIGEAGIQVGKSLVYFDRSGKAPTVNGVAMSNNQTVNLGNGNFAKWDGKILIVKTDEYTIDLQVKQPDKNGGYLDSNVTVNEGVNPLADGVTPHGLLGQTADGVSGARKGGDGNLNIEKQGGDVIDGVVEDYQVETLWDNQFKYNRFQSHTDSSANPLMSLLQGLSADLAA